ncbi:MAG: TIGR03943 family protein [Luteolibacter sp.]
MNVVIRRSLPALSVLVWSGVILYFYASGRIDAYLAPDFRIFAFLGGLGLAVLGCFCLLTVRREVGGGHHHEEGDIHPVLAAQLMVLPVFLAVSWTKDSYSPAALARKGAFDRPAPAMVSGAGKPLTKEAIEQAHRKTEDGFYRFNLMELFFATGDRELQTALEGMKVETEGRWLDEKNGPATESRKRLYRLFMTCCVADSRAVPIVLDFGGNPPEFSENSWVKVAGTMRFPVEQGALQPVLHVERVDAAEAPAEEIFLGK